MSEKFIIPSGKEKLQKKNSLEKLGNFFKRRILVGSLAIASLTTFDGCVQYHDYTAEGTFNAAFKKARANKDEEFKWKGKKFTTHNAAYEQTPGVKYYSPGGSFNNAFKSAHDHSKKEFVWHGKRYNTHLIDSEFSKLYWESKKFLEDYYSSDYFKNKYNFAPSRSDSAEAEEIVENKIKSNPRYKYLENKLENSDEGLTDEEFNEYDKFFNQSDMERIYKTKIFKELLDSISKENSEARKTIEGRIRELNEPTYFSITRSKGERHSDGSYDKNNKAVFISANNSPMEETVSAHELSHKSSKGNKDIVFKHWAGLKHEALQSVLKNHLMKKYYEEAGDGKGHISEEGIRSADQWVDYITNPTEIDARQNSTRFWLHRHFPEYKVDTKFTEEHLDFLKKNYATLPYDIQQLLDLFPEKEIFVKNMNEF